MPGPTCITGVFERGLECDATSERLAVLSAEDSEATGLLLHLLGSWVCKEALKVDGEDVLSSGENQR